MNKIYRWIWLQRNVGKFVAKLYQEYTENGGSQKEKKRWCIIIELNK